MTSASATVSASLIFIASVAYDRLITIACVYRFVRQRRSYGNMGYRADSSVDRFAGCLHDCNFPLVCTVAEAKAGQIRGGSDTR